MSPYLDKPLRSVEQARRDIRANQVLVVLRETHGVEPAIGIPMPNTGITVRLDQR